MKFVVKFSFKGGETTAGEYEDFASAKARVAELVAEEADYAWVEVTGYPELRTTNKHKLIALPPEPVEKVLDKPSPKAKVKLPG